MIASTPNLGESLRRARVERSLSLAAVAEEAGVSVATLSRVETNKQKIDVAMLLTLARVLGVPPAELLGSHDDEDDLGSLARRLARLRAPERTKVFLDASRRRDGNKPATLVEDLLSALDVLREELLHVQRAVRRRRRNA